MTPLTKWYGNGYGEILTCPQCGFEYTHITAITTTVETDSNATHVQTAPEGKMTIQPCGNEWAEFASLTIHIHCENCGHVPLKFAQHKGYTIVTRERTG